MNISEFNRYIDSRLPMYHLEHEGLFNELCNKRSQDSTRNRFGPFYQLYMYAFFIGYHTNTRVAPPDRTDMRKFLEFGSWRHNNSEITSLMLMIVINETVDDLHILETGDDETVKTKVNEMFEVMDEFVHGGLNYIKMCIDESKIELDDVYKFYRILLDIAKPNDN